MADNISLEKMCDNDREQFIADNQYAFKYGIGTDEDSAEKLYKISEDEEVIDRETIEESIKNGVAFLSFVLTTQIDEKCRDISKRPSLPLVT